MRAVIQRVSQAEVVVNNEVIGSIGAGLVILIAVHVQDVAKDAEKLASKIVGLRIFDDDQGRMNRSLVEVGAQALVVSQFTLYADTDRGRRPSYSKAAPPEKAVALYELFVSALERQGIRVQTGQFRASMSVRLVNEGPVTLIVDAGDYDVKSNRIS